MLKYNSNLQQAGDIARKVNSLAYSSNSKKLALACFDKTVYLHDENGERRDKIPTKGADKVNTNYNIRALDFSPDGTILAVAQSDQMILGYKIGTDWGEKKAICSKIPTGAAPTCIVWPRTSLLELFFGCTDGSVKIGYLKTHKAQTIYTGSNYVVSLASEGRAGKVLVSGHLDGALFLYNADTQTFKKIYSCGFAPWALDFGKSIVVAGKRAVLFLDRKGNLSQRFDEVGDFDRASVNQSGDTAALVGSNSIVLFSLNSKRGEWEKTATVAAENYVGCTAALWRPDGARLVTASQTGSVDFFDLAVRRLRFKGKFELNYVSSSKLRILHLEKQTESVIESVRGLELQRVDIQRDKYVVAQTAKTLVLAELGGRFSEIEWGGAGAPRVEFCGGAAWAALAGELTVVELGRHEPSAVFRTELARRAVVSASVRSARRFASYLLDLQTVNILNLSTGISECTIEHEAKIVGLRLNARATKLLFKDARRGLFLFDLVGREKVSLLPCCGFWAWVPDSDVIVAQAGGALSVWYSADAPDRRIEIPTKGTANDIRTGSRITVVVAEASGEHEIELDQLLVRFGSALESRDLCACARILEEKREAQHTGQWAALLSLALEMKSLVIAERCYAALGDVTKAEFIRKTRKLMRQGRTVEAEAKLLMLEGQFARAEALLLEREEAEKVIEMYQSLHRWEDALRVAERYRASEFETLKKEYLKWLIDSSQLEKAAEFKDREGVPREAAELFLQAGLAARAGQIALRERFEQGDALTAKIVAALLKEECWEKLGLLYERFGDVAKSVGLFAKAGSFQKAVELSRARAPEMIVGLEEKWGDALVGENQKEAAVSHYIESKQPVKAIEAAIGARAWARAAQLLGSLSADESEKFCLRIAEQLEKSKQFELAEKYFVKAKRPQRAFGMWVGQLRMREARKFAAEAFKPEEVAEQWIAAAKATEKERRLDEAEKLYVEAGKPELAIKMYKGAGLWDKMLRLFALHRPENLKDAHTLVGKKLEEEDQLAKAEKHYVEGGGWAYAVDMYEKRRSFEDCLRVLKNHANERDIVERLKRWDSLIGQADLVATLRRIGLRDVLIDYLAEKKCWDEAFKEAALVKHKKQDVHLAFAMFLEDEKNFREAEKHYVLAGKFDQAVQMHIEQGDFAAAAALAKAHDPGLLADIQVRQATQASEAGDYEKMEIGFIAGRKPELAVRAYLKAGRPVDALRVAKKHCPELVKEVNAQLGGEHGEDALKRGRLLEDSREYEAAIDSYLQATPGSASKAELEAAWEKAIQLSLTFAKHRYIEVTKVVCKRLREQGSIGVAAEYYEAAGLHEEAFKSYLQINDFESAKKILAFAAPELQQDLRGQLDRVYKAHLKSRGEAEQLVGQNEVKEGLDLMVDRGDWVQALTIAHSKSPDLFCMYLRRYLKEAMDAGKFGEVLGLLTKFGMPQNAELLELYERLVDETFALCEPTEINDLKNILYDFLQKFDGHVFNEKVRASFDRFLFLSHLIKQKMAYESHKLLGLQALTCCSLLRFIDLTTIDRPFYDAGRILRDVGDEVQSFVFLNRYLDIFEMIEEQRSEIDDSPELKKTDIPEIKNLRLPQSNAITADEKKAIRDWLLKVSVSKGTELRLPSKKCVSCLQDIYTGCVTCPFCRNRSAVCYLTGAPLEPKRAKECRFCLKMFDVSSLKVFAQNFSNCPWCTNKLEA